MPSYYPIMLDIRKRAVLVLGGDRIAAEKATALVRSGAQVTVQHSSFGDEILAMAEQEQVTLRQKEFEASDLVGAFVVVAATQDAELIEQLWSETQARGQLLNIVDVPARCNYIVPSILRRGRLTIAVSTEGASPSLAKRIRHQLEEEFPPVYENYMHLATVVRAHMRKSGLSYDQRDDFFGHFFSSRVLSLLQEGEEEQALALTVELLRHYHVEISTATIRADLREAVAHYENLA